MADVVSSSNDERNLIAITAAAQTDSEHPLHSLYDKNPRWLML